MTPFLIPGFVLPVTEININREYYSQDLRSDQKPRTELFIKNPQTLFGKMRPHINIGVIGHHSARSTLLIAAAIAEQFPGKEVKITWIEPDHSELFDKIFPEKEQVVYEITRGGGITALDCTIPITLKNPPLRSDFNFLKGRKGKKFNPDPKSLRFKAKHRRA